jgi:hypothetical protein
MNLNDKKYSNKQLITKRLLLNEITDLEIYNMYMGNKSVDLNKPILSPLLPEKKASFGFFIGQNNEIYFKDFRLGGGDCIKFVQMMFDLDYNEALSKVAYDFKIEEHFICKKMNNTITNKTIDQNRTDLFKTNIKFKLGKKKRDWQLHDVKYWKSFGITIDILTKYNVQPVSYIFLNDNIVKADRHAYCYIEYKDGIETYKIYQPFSDKLKWLNSHNDSVWQGWKQLPNKGTSLILTKSLKDVMAIAENYNIPSVSLQAESIKPKDKIIQELHSRFFNIFLLYDNDFDKDINWGQQYANKLVDTHNFINIVIPDEYECKDFSDLIKKYGNEKAKSILDDLINNTLPF